MILENYARNWSNWPEWAAQAESMRLQTAGIVSRPTMIRDSRAGLYTLEDQEEQANLRHFVCPIFRDEIGCEPNQLDGLTAEEELALIHRRTPSHRAMMEREDQDSPQRGRLSITAEGFRL